jgi:ABC-type transport system involved in multi-copper enzyme maturation permease subunit
MSRWGLGPVFIYDCVTSARRWQTYAARTACPSVLLACLTAVWADTFAGAPDTVALSGLAQVGELYYFAVVGTQLVLVLLAAPAYAAGAVCLDKARGNLAHVLVTDLSAVEIVLGKLGSRLLPVVGFVVAGLPILALATLLGGIDPDAVFGGFVVMLGMAVVGCALALALSVLGNKPYEVLLVTYLALAVLLVAWPGGYLWPRGWGPAAAPAWLEKSNPFWLAFAPYLHGGGTDPEDYVIFLAGCLGLSALLTALAAATLRRAAARESVRQGRRGDGTLGRWLLCLGPCGSELLSVFRDLCAVRRLLPPSMDSNPVLWREWHTRRPSRWVRAVWIIYVLLSLVASLLALAVWDTAKGDEFAACVAALQYSIGLLFVSVASVTSLFEERVRGSLDVLLTTPLPTSSIVRGKWWGTYRSVLLVMVLPVATVSCLALLNLEKHRWRDLVKVQGWVLLLAGLMLAYGAAVTSLGLAVATWVKRFGVAVGFSVSAYVLVAGGSLLALIAVRPFDAAVRRVLAYVSPWYGVFAPTLEIVDRVSGAEPVSAAILWGGSYACLALVLALATRDTFDRCMGRVRDD